MKAKDKKRAKLEITYREAKKAVKIEATVPALIRVFEIKKKGDKGIPLSKEEYNELFSYHKLVHESQEAWKTKKRAEKALKTIEMQREDQQSIEEKRKFYEDAMKRAAEKNKRVATQEKAKEENKNKRTNE